MLWSLGFSSKQCRGLRSGGVGEDGGRPAGRELSIIETACRAPRDCDGILFRIGEIFHRNIFLSSLVFMFLFHWTLGSLLESLNVYSGKDAALPS